MSTPFITHTPIKCIWPCPWMTVLTPIFPPSFFSAGHKVPFTWKLMEEMHATIIFQITKKPYTQHTAHRLVIRLYALSFHNSFMCVFHCCCTFPSFHVISLISPIFCWYPLFMSRRKLLNNFASEA